MTMETAAMRKAKYTEEQMVKILREADKTPVPEVAKKYGLSGETDLRVASSFRCDDGGRSEADEGARVAKP
jgi:hypothetical protein